MRELGARRGAGVAVRLVQAEEVPLLRDLRLFAGRPFLLVHADVPEVRIHFPGSPERREESFQKADKDEESFYSVTSDASPRKAEEADTSLAGSPLKTHFLDISKLRVSPCPFDCSFPSF